MRTYASRGEVTRFLSEVKKCIIDDRITFLPREKNLTALIALGIDEPRAWQVIKSLTVRNYHIGPEQDREWRRFEGDVWIFGSTVHGSRGELQPVYIKLKLGQDRRQSYLLCLSFHETRTPLYCPFK